jgi:hypothetical protein
VFMQNIINFPLNIEPYAPQMIRDAGRSVPLVFVEPARSNIQTALNNVTVNRFQQDGGNK